MVQDRVGQAQHKYVKYYNVLNVNATYADVDVVVSGARDMALNTQNVYTGTDALDIALEGPTLTSVTIASNNTNGGANPTWAKVGDIVTINITGIVDLQNVTATIATHNATITDAGDADAKTWRAQYTMTSGDAEGLVPFVINFQDLTSNPGAPVSAITSGSNVTFDRTVPVVVVNTPSVGTKVNTRTITYTVTESHLGANTGSANGTTFVAFASGAAANTLGGFAGLSETTFTATIRHTDAAGNTGDGTVSLIKDVTAPDISTIALTCNNTSATINFTEPVYSTANGSGQLDYADFVVTKTGGGSSLTTSYLTLPIPAAGSNTIPMSMIWVNSFTGNELVSIDGAAASIYDEAGNALVNGTPATKYVNFSPQVTAQPANTAVCVNGNTSLNATVTLGGAGATQIWQVYNSGTSSWDDLTNVAPYSGVSTSTLTLTSVSAGLNNKLYRLKNFNTCYTTYTNEVTLTVNPATSIANHPASTPICVGTTANLSVVAAGTAPYTYTWKYENGANNWVNAANNMPAGATITGLGTANISVSGLNVGSFNFRADVVGACGASVSSNPATVTVNALPTPTISGLNAGLTGTPLVLTTEAGMTGYTWNVDGATIVSGSGTNEVSLNWPTIGDKSVTVTYTNPSGCSATSAAHLVSVASGCDNVSVATLTASPVSTCQGSNVTLSVTANGTLPITYAWHKTTDPVTVLSTTSTLELTNIQPAAAGDYYVVISNGCPSNATSGNVTVNVTAQVTPSVAIALTSGTNPICAGNSVTFTAAPTHGGTPSYQWKVNNINVGTGLSTYSYTPVNGDVVKVEMISNLTCVTTSTVLSNEIVMTVNPLPTAPTLASVNRNNFCSTDAGTISLTAINGSGTTMEWSTVSNFATTIGTGTPLVINSPEATTTYYVRWTTVCGNSNYASVTVNVTPAVTPAVAIASSDADNSIFNGQSVTFTATPSNLGSGTAAYQWKNNNVDIPSATLSTYTTTTLASGNSITCQITVSNGCVTTTTATSTPIVTTINSLPVLSVTTQPTAVCSPNTVNLATAVFADANSTTGTISYYSNAAGTIPLANPNAVTAGTYYAKKTTTSGCESNVVTLTATVNALPTPTISGLNTTAVAANIALTTQAGFSNYVWNVNGATVVSGSGTNSITLNWGTEGTKNVTVSYQNANGCTGTSANFAVTVTPGCAPATIATLTSGPVTVCQGGSTSLTATANGTTPITYTWYKVGSSSAVGTGTTLILTNIQTSQAGEYYVVLSNACTVGTPSSNITLNVNTVPAQPSSITGNYTVCAGTTAQTYSVTNVVGVTYAWTYSGTGVSAITDTDNSITIDFASNATSGTLTVVPSNGCGNGTAQTLNITVNPLPAAASSISGATSLCAGSTGNGYSVTSVAGVSYTWSYSGAGATITGSGNAVSLSFSNVATSGILSVTPSNGCGNGPSSTIDITINHVPATPSAIVGNSTVAAGTTNVAYSVTAVPDVNYAWTYSGTGATLTPTANAVNITFASNATSGILSITPSNSCGNGTASTMAINVSSAEPDASQCATLLRVTGVTSTNVSLAWNSGSANSRVVIIASSSSSYIQTLPNDFVSNYVANASYTAASDLSGVLSSTTTAHVVYDGIGSAMTVSGLSFNTPYYFRLFTYFADANNTYSSRNYNTTSYLSVSARTNRKEGETQNIDLSTNGFQVSNVTPNPVSSEMNFTIDAYEAGRFEAELYDAAGRVVYSRSLDLNAGPNAVTLPIITTGKLAAGKYNLRVRTGEGFVDQQVVVMP